MSNFVLLCWIIWHSEEEKPVKERIIWYAMASSKLLKAIFVQSQNHLQLYSREFEMVLIFVC